MGGMNAVCIGASCSEALHPYPALLACYYVPVSPANTFAEEERN